MLQLAYLSGYNHYPGASATYILAGTMITGADPVILLLTVVVAPAIVFFLVSKLFVYGKKKGDSKLPPGDKGWPFVGSTFSLYKPHPSSSLNTFMQLQLSRYGKIFSTRYLGKIIIISADAEFNRFVLKNEMRLFQNDLPLYFRTLLGEDNMSFFTGEAYKRNKSWMHGFFNNCQIETRFFAEVEEAAKRVMTQWSHKTITHAYEETSKFVFSLAIGIGMGLTPDDPEVENLRKAFITVTEGLYVAPINLPFTRYSKALKARDIIWSTIKRKVDERKINNRKNEKNDLIWYFMNDTSVSVQSICDGVLGFVTGAVFSTQITIAMAMHFLEGNPKSLQQIREEFKEKVKERNATTKLTWDDYKNMEFCQSVINETLRFGNAVPALWRKTLSDINFKDYIIPQETTIVVHTAAVHLDPSSFENPNVFDPWRWLATKKNNNWMPFSGGVRYCCGAEIARIEMAVFLCHLVLNYDWEPVEPDHPVAFPMVTFPKGYPIKIRPLGENTL